MLSLAAGLRWTCMPARALDSCSISGLHPQKCNYSARAAWNVMWHVGLGAPPLPRTHNHIERSYTPKNIEIALATNTTFCWAYLCCAHAQYNHVKGRRQPGTAFTRQINRPNWTKCEQAISQEEIPLSLHKMSLSTDPGTFPEGNESV